LGGGVPPGFPGAPPPTPNFWLVVVPPPLLLSPPPPLWLVGVAPHSHGWFKVVGFVFASGAPTGFPPFECCVFGEKKTQKTHPSSRGCFLFCVGGGAITFVYQVLWGTLLWHFFCFWGCCFCLCFCWGHPPHSAGVLVSLLFFFLSQKNTPHLCDPSFFTPGPAKVVGFSGVFVVCLRHTFFFFFFFLIFFFCCPPNNSTFFRLQVLVVVVLFFVGENPCREHFPPTPTPPIQGTQLGWWAGVGAPDPPFPISLCWWLSHFSNRFPRAHYVRSPPARWAVFVSLFPV